MLRQLAKLGAGSHLDLMSQTARWWRAQMMREASQAGHNVSEQPPEVQATGTATGWPADDHWPKTPWR